MGFEARPSRGTLPANTTARTTYRHSLIEELNLLGVTDSFTPRTLHICHDSCQSLDTLSEKILLCPRETDADPI